MEWNQGISLQKGGNNQLSSEEFSNHTSKRLIP